MRSGGRRRLQPGLDSASQLLVTSGIRIEKSGRLIDSPKACAPGYLDVIRAREPERPLSRVNKIHPALKHGAYTATAVPSGGNRGRLRKLQVKFIAELALTGLAWDRSFRSGNERSPAVDARFRSWRRCDGPHFQSDCDCSIGPHPFTWAGETG